MEQFISGELKKIFRVSSHTLLVGLTVGGKRVWQQEEEQKGDQHCTDASGKIVYFRALQGHSGRNLIDPSLQDNVIIQSNLGCAFNLHSIISSGLIPGGQSSQTVFFLLVDPVEKSHKEPKVIDLDVPRHAQYLHKAWKRHQDAVYWVDINLATTKGLKFCQTRSNAIILHETLPANCIPKAIMTETGEVLIRKSIHVTSASTKDLIETRMEKRIGFRTRLPIRSWASIKKFPIEPTNSQSNS